MLLVKLVLGDARTGWRPCTVHCGYASPMAAAHYAYAYLHIINGCDHFAQGLSVMAQPARSWHDRCVGCSCHRLQSLANASPLCESLIVQEKSQRYAQNARRVPGCPAERGMCTAVHANMRALTSKPTQFLCLALQTAGQPGRRAEACHCSAHDQR
jgi:hypothetical protein